MRLPRAAAIGPRRASILFHHNCSPISIYSILILNEQALSATTHTTIVVVGTAATVIASEQRAQSI
jgi:hypothetical protein